MYAADEAWFAECDISAYDISSITNPLSWPEGLNQVARMVADRTITVRIGSTR